MIHFTKEEEQKIAVYMASALTEMQYCDNAKDVIANLYCSIMEEDNVKKGRNVADRASAVVVDFKNVMADNEAQTIENLNRFYNENTQMLQHDQKVRLLQDLHCCVAGLRCENGEWICAPDHTAVVADDAQADTAMLLQKIAGRITGLCENTDLDAVLAQTKDINFADRDYMLTVLGLDMYAAVRGVIVYCMAKKREIANMPDNVSIAQCVLSSYIEANVMDAIGYQYINSKNDEWLKKEIAKLLVCFLPAALLMTLLVAVIVVFAVVVLASGVTVEGVILTAILTIMQMFVIGQVIQEVVCPMLEEVQDDIKKMKLFAQEMVQVSDGKSEAVVSEPQNVHTDNLLQIQSVEDVAESLND